jgi:hypothetical protein
MKFYTQNSLEVIVCTELLFPNMHLGPFCISNSFHFRDLCKIKLFWHQIYFLYMIPPSEIYYFSLYKYYSMCNPVCMPKIMAMSQLWAEELSSAPKYLIQYTHISNLQIYIVLWQDPMVFCPLIPAWMVENLFSHTSKKGNLSGISSSWWSWWSWLTAYVLSFALTYLSIYDQGPNSHF